ncbi:hypothetical protein [Streptococcus moroccensis]|uniref:Glycoside hydrolase n=1 Tax=Streptococcus moroccensis TaxID=1451356 RepID=A0ABT9YS31_9STRE|nr:hypothetical protein [Streptococcus moroccensis]MDQ0222427.1 hypothetical protein [Streptococcus moroccensis]
MTNVTNHFYPFFWQHGESEVVLRDYVSKIYQSGMRGVCIESRPHPDFVGDKWWRDLEIILEECQKREIKAWILDDSHFPTGYANGKIKEHYPQYRKQYLTYRRFDLVGPFEGARIDASQLKGRPWEIGQTDIIEVIGTYLVGRPHNRTEEGDPVDICQLYDISSRYKDDTIFLDIPKGDWSVFVIFSTYEGGEESTKDYLNPLVSDATQVLVDEVYERHYQKLSQYFGRTITAFFSDEPRFGNIKGTQARIGTEQVLPWRSGLEKELTFEPSHLILLWTSSKDGSEKEIRVKYMDLITKLYHQNFTKVLAEWCSSHGVDYVGHNIEDNGAHSRLGYGAGHFFRGQEAQHFSGIDVIGGQIVPGMPYHHDAYQTGGSDGQFYHYALAKLGVSAAHLSPHKQGRAMCEAFGAYGWNEGLKTMKWITDHLMVRGINYIVPHAFSPKTFPDFDCPPHFYAHGHNPQYRYMHHLTTYANRIMSYLSEGKHIASVAVLYPAELEWGGQAMSVELVTRELTEHQLDMDIVSLDHIEFGSCEDGKLAINEENFKALVVPEAEYYSERVVATLNRLLDNGVKVLLINKKPKTAIKLKSGYEVVDLSQLTNTLANMTDIILETAFPDLVYYHYQKSEKDYYLFFNESLSEIVNSKVYFSNIEGNPVAYDAYLDKYSSVIDHRLILKPYETIMWVFGEDGRGIDIDVPRNNFEMLLPLKGKWEVSLSSAIEYPVFNTLTNLPELTFINELSGYERYVGTVAYESQFEVEEASKIIGLVLERAYEIVEVFINGKSTGVRIAPPYVFDVAPFLKTGRNTIRIEVTNTLGTQFRGGLNQYLTVEPFGLKGQIKLIAEI